MMPQDRAEAAYRRWTARMDDDLRQRLDGTPYRDLFIEVVAAAIAEAQETVALGTGSAEPEPAAA
jgi:hypothetical protein